MYYIVVRFDPGSEYAWIEEHGNPYPPGVSSHPYSDWDYTFRTIVDKSTISPVMSFLKDQAIINTPLTKILEQVSHAFPILRNPIGF